jgi:hypothetical protein
MRCPVCKVENAQGPSCRRCKADLSLLFGLEEERERALAAVRAEMAAGRWWAAHGEARRADHLRSDEESRRLRAVTAMMEGDFYEAWRCYGAVGKAEQGSASG